MTWPQTPEAYEQIETRGYYSLSCAEIGVPAEEASSPENALTLRVCQPAVLNKQTDLPIQWSHAPTPPCARWQVQFSCTTWLDLSSPPLKLRQSDPQRWNWDAARAGEISSEAQRSCGVGRSPRGCELQGEPTDLPAALGLWSRASSCPPEPWRFSFY